MRSSRAGCAEVTVGSQLGTSPPCRAPHTPLITRQCTSLTRAGVLALSMWVSAVRLVATVRILSSVTDA